MLVQKFFLFFAGVVILCSQFLVAQEAPKDQLYLVHEETAKAEMINQYEATSVEWVEMMHKAELDIDMIHASQTEDFTYYYLIPISGYAEIDGFPAKFNSAVEKLGEDKWSALMTENYKSIQTYREYVIKWSADLSYVPKEPRIKQDEQSFIHWIFFHYKADKRQEMMDVLKEWKKLYEDKNINTGYSIWTMELGEDNNLLVLTEYAKSAIDFYQTLKSNNEITGKDEQVLWNKFTPLLINFEQKYGYFRPDLSYIKK